MARKMTEASMKHYFGWAQSSKMAGVYVHMSGKDTDEAILHANGIEIKKEIKVSKLSPKNCSKCDAINEFTNRFCKICGMPLDKEIADKIIREDSERQRADKIMNKLLEDKEILSLIKKKISS